jgi:hypothetical protein
MSFDFTDQPTPDTDHADDTWLDEIGDLLSSVGSHLVDLAVPDVPTLEDVTAETAEAEEPGGSAGDLPNNGFYQSLPGIDSTVGAVLDQNAQLCADIDEFGKETFGEEAWAEAGEVAATDPYGLLEGIESPSDMWARHHKEDAQANADFEAWRSNQQVINDAEELAYDTETLLRYGY